VEREKKESGLHLSDVRHGSKSADHQVSLERYLQW